MARITEWNAKKAGKKDGKNDYPPPNYDGQNGKYSEFEHEVAAVAAEEIDNAVKEWKRRETETLKELETLVPELRTSFQRFNNILETCKKQFGEDVAPEPPRRYGKAIFILLLLLIFEGGVNILTFHFLREPGLTTIIIGLALTLLIPFAGFYSGKILKAKEKRPMEWAFAAILVILAVTLILIVAQGRKIGIEVRKLDPKVVEITFWIFLVMNIIFFTFALIDGYYYSYTYPSLQKAYEELRRRKRQYMNRRARLIDAFNETLGYVRQKLDTAQYLSLVYREANRRARGHVPPDQLPKYFQGGFILPVKIPSEFAQYLNQDDPVKAYEQELMTKPTIREGQDLIDEIEIFER